MLEANPSTDLAVAIVWLPMLPADDGHAAGEAGRLVADPRARHFYDPARRAGQAIARSLGTAGAEEQTAWDMYLFYDRLGRWQGEPPPPSDWLHQLHGRAWADQRRWRWGDDLAAGLLEATGRLLTQ